MKSILKFLFRGAPCTTLLFGAVLLGPYLAIAQQAKEPRLVYWHERAKLTWDDFKGKELSRWQQGTPGVLARSRVGIFYENHRYQSSPDTLAVAIKAVFNRLLSPVRPGAKNERLLSHEQLHFDMTEVLARKIRREIALADFNDPSIRRQHPKNIKKLKEEYIVQQRAYDEQSYVSAEKQKEWIDNVANELDSLKEYSHPEVKLPVKKMD